MSILIDGIAFPDLPSDALKKYPYAVIFFAGGTSSVYMACLSKGPTAYIPANLVTNPGSGTLGILTTNVLGYKWLIYNEKNNTWINSLEFETDKYFGPIDSPSAKCYIKWANHTIYIASSYIEGTTGVPDSYTLTNKVYLPGQGVLIGMSDYPPVPDYLKSSYPYAIILQYNIRAIDSNSLYGTFATLLIRTSTPVLYLSLGIGTQTVEYIISESTGAIVSALNENSSDWIESSEENMDLFYPLLLQTDESDNLKSVLDIVASNHDIKIVDLEASEEKNEIIFSGTLIPGSGEIAKAPNPLYQIKRLDMVQLVQQIRRVNESSESLSSEEMGVIWANVEKLEDAEELKF